MRSKKNCYEEVYRVCLLWTTAVEMDKFIQIGEKFGLEREKLLEFVREQLKLEEEKEENVDNWNRKKKKSVDC